MNINKYSLKILNLSHYTLSPSHISLLSKGLKFTPSPNHNLLELQCDVDDFCRKLRLQEYFFSNTPQLNSSLISNSSTFTPNKHRNQYLDTVINVMEKISTPENLKSHIPPKSSNLDTAESLAMKSLINNRNIIIKEADKGGVAVIMDRDYYIDKISSILNDDQYYQISSSTEEKAIISQIKAHITRSSFLTKQEASYITDFTPNCSNIYGLPKIHKSKIIQHAISNAPDKELIQNISPTDLTFRPIIAGPASPTHRLSNFLHLIFSSLISQIPSYIKDSTTFLHKLPQTLEYPCYLCTMDIVNLYSNIPHDLGINAIEYWTSKLPPTHSRFPVEFIIESLKIVLDKNIFNFNGRFYKQIHGTAMGTKCAPYYATLTLAYIEKVIIAPKLEQTFGTNVKNYYINNFHRYLDDCFILWPKSFPSFQNFLEILNKAHPSIKYTSEISENSIAFLDVLITITTGNKILTDIHRKPTDSLNYLHFYSSHPSHIKRNIPYTLSRRICTIVNDQDLKQIRLQEMKTILLSKKYPVKLVENAISKSLSIPQNILRISRKSNNHNKLPLTLTFNQNNPNITGNIMNIFQTLKIHENTEQIFKNSSLQICRRQPPNLKRLLTKAKIQPSSNENSVGVLKCNRPRCKCCEIIVQDNNFFFSQCNKTFKVKNELNCLSKFVIYTLICKKCQKYYIGLTTNHLCSRITVHRQHVNNPTTAPLNVSRHIAECAKDLDPKFAVFPFFQVANQCLTTLRRMESHFIKTLKPELNSI